MHLSDEPDTPNARASSWDGTPESYTQGHPESQPIPWGQGHSQTEASSQDETPKPIPSPGDRGIPKFRAQEHTQMHLPEEQGTPKPKHSLRMGPLDPMPMGNPKPKASSQGWGPQTQEHSQTPTHPLVRGAPQLKPPGDWGKPKPNTSSQRQGL